MFYSSNDNYMQDLYFYNQMQNPTYNPYMVNQMNTNNMAMGLGVNQDPLMNNGFVQNPNMMVDPNRNMMQNTQMGFQNNLNQNRNVQNPNNLYPSIYRIINPVVSRVISGNTNQFLTEDNLNNMVDTVYNIVEGQIEVEEDPITRTTGVEERSTSSNLSNTTNSNNSSRTTTMERSSTSNSTTTNISSNTGSSSQSRSRNDSILKDLIKILILREWFSRNQNPYYFNNRQGFYNQNCMQQPGFFQNM